MPDSYDVIVLGGGANELVAAHLLARAGRRVLVLDTCTDAPIPALTSRESGWVPGEIVRELGLESHGFDVDRPDPWAEAPLAAGGRLQLWQDRARSVESIRRISARDAQRWPEFCERMARLARLLESVYTAPPPDPLASGWRDQVQLAALGWRTRRLGREGLEDLLRTLPIPVADLLDDWFESDVLKGVLGAGALMHLCHGPRSGGTAFALLHRHAGSPAGVFRPPLSNIGPVLRALPGIELRGGAQVVRIEVRAQRVGGVVLSNGEELSAPRVLSGLDPKHTLLGLIDTAWLDPDLTQAVRHIRSRGVAGRVVLELDRAPGFTTLVAAPSLDYLERACDDAKYRRLSQRPFLEARHAGAAGGRHRVEMHVQYAPYRLSSGDWDEVGRGALGRVALETLGAHVTGIEDAVVERHVFSPRDLETAEGWPQGQAYHAELALDQALWMRPVPQLARYRTPIGGLYLCGPAMHPGAGIAGAAGLHCAREIMAGW